jgi:competence protein ComEC
MEKRQTREWVLLALVGGSLLFGVPQIERATRFVSVHAAPENAMSLFVFDVGQGDAILAQQGDRQILIDGGPDASVLEKLGATMPVGDRSIDLVVLTHPHADHLNGLVSVLERYDVRRVLMTDVAAPTSYYRRWRELIAKNGIAVDDPRSINSERVGGMEYEVLSSGTQAGLRGSFHDGNSDGLNDSSIVGILKFKGRRFLLTGDATSAIETRLLAEKVDLTADLLKVGHHGSNYSTSSDFFAAVEPHYSAVSVGAKNSYGNPAWRVMRLLESAGAVSYRTDENGTVAAITDGGSLQVTAERIE